MKNPFSFVCNNCKASVTEKLDDFEIKVMKQLGGCCNACCAIASSYYSSEAYKAFEESEENFDYHP